MNHLKKALLLTVLLSPMMVFACEEHSAQCACGKGDGTTKQHCDKTGHDHGAQSAILKKPFQQKNDAAMIDMHNAMAAVAFSGNDDIDFMALMIPHHEGAIKMAEIILATSTDVEVRNMAQGIITEQKNEINIMNHLIEARKK